MIAIETINFLYIIGILLALGILFIPWVYSYALFLCFSALYFIAGTILLFIPEFPLFTITNNNFLLLRHGKIDVFLVIAVGIITIVGILQSVHWEVDK